MAMKKINLIKLFISVGMLSIMGGCKKYLDYEEQSMLSYNEIFNTQSRAKAVLSNIYDYLPSDFSSVNGAMRSSASDDAEHVYDYSDIQKFNDGSWSSLEPVDDVWGRMYTGIRQSNSFIKYATGETFSYLKYNQGYDQLMAEYKLYSYEARFLRAFFYFELSKRYANLPLVTDILTPEQANEVVPVSYDSITQFIVNECDVVAANLPVNYNAFINKESGRATKGSALALKARVLLYAASPLHNTANNKTKWINAATAAKELIDQMGATYTPLPAYTAISNNLSSKELILERRQAADGAFEQSNTAIGFIGGNTGTCPTQNLVDAYEMKASGLGIGEVNSGYNPLNPYNGRDPRLAMTVLYNGSTWKSVPVQVWNGGLNAPPALNATKTGYYLRKHMVESVSLNPVSPTTADHNWVIFRYGEILLNYAEAMNEAFGPDAAGPAPLDNMTAQTAVNIVRARTGVDMPGFPAGMSQDAFRDKLRNERRVELAFEDHRFWDIRRWKIGNLTTVIKGMDLAKDPVTGVISFNPKVVETRVWSDRMYLYPIPQTEIFKNPKLVQNPGW
jgi:hypothetical protein